MIAAALACLAMSAQSMDCMPPKLTELACYPSGTLMKGIGSSVIDVTTTNEKALELVRQGFALRHCFWFNESLRAFRDATKEDPNCALAWFGVHLAATNPWYALPSLKLESDYAIRRAMLLCKDASSLEISLIAAYRTYALKHDQAEFYRLLEDVVRRFPKAIEPKLLLSGHLVQVCMGSYDANGNPKGEMAVAYQLAKDVLAIDPKNAGAHHYVIHALEGGARADLALQSADALGKCAPLSSHMVHMPGHIYFRVGKYAEARQAFAESTAVDEKYFESIKSGTSANWNYGHNLDFAIANLCEMGRFSEARSLLKKLRGSDDDANGIRWRDGDWSGIDPSRVSDDYDAFALANAYFERNDLQNVRKQLARLDEKVANVKDEDQNSWPKVLRTQSYELHARLLAAEGKFDEAKLRFEDACREYSRIGYDEPPDYPMPPSERLGYAMIAARRFGDAETAFNKALHDRPRSGHGFFGLFKTHEQAGNRNKALHAAEVFLRAWSEADADHRYITEAKAFLARNKK